MTALATDTAMVIPTRRLRVPLADSMPPSLVRLPPARTVPKGPQPIP